MFPTAQSRSLRTLLVALAFSAGSAGSARAGLLTTESFFLPSGAGNPASAPYMDMLVNTSPSVTDWGVKGAIGLQGPSSQFYNGTSYVNVPASTVAFKFNIGAAIDSLNAAYGAGNWTISSPALTVQYTYYANNNIFGGGAGSFETYYVANNNWAFGNGGSAGNSYGSSNYVSGTDPAYANSAATLLTWAGSQADLGSTTYNWLSPASNPNYTSWSTAKTGPNQGLLAANLYADPLLVGAITSASAAGNPNVSLYLTPDSSTLGLTIFTGGGNQTPELSFNVVSAPEPASIGMAGLFGTMALLLIRRRI
jgi:hypothetical protein